jgi:hypothetical protein
VVLGMIGSWIEQVPNDRGTTAAIVKKRKQSTSKIPSFDRVGHKCLRMRYAPGRA